MDGFFIITSLLKIVGILFVVILPMVSYAVYAERRVSAFIQDRLGPNRVGPAGLFQPVADMFKLLLKEDFTPRSANTFYYWLAPCLAVMPAIITIAVVPFGSTLFGVPMVIADVNVGILFVFAIASLGVYGIVIGGWASNSKYPFLGGIRSSSQMLSYELSLGLAVIPVFLLVGNLRLTTVVRYQIEHGWFIAPFVGDWTNPWKWLLAIPMIISFLVFMIAIFAETNRLPFDLPEAEQELAGGYNIEYSSIKFALYFLGEYAAMITGSAVIVAGLGLAINHFTDQRLGRTQVTMQYPEQRWDTSLPDHYRGAPALVRDDDGRVRCVACQLCEFICPPRAIKIIPGEIPSADRFAKVEKYPEEFDIDMIRCIFCGMCEEVCPEQAIFLRKDYVITGFTRADMIHHKKKLLEIGGVMHGVVLKWNEKK